MKLDEQQLEICRETLKNVVDPELAIDIVNLGLVYGVDSDEDGKVLVTMTLTSPGCPLAPEIEADVRMYLKELPFVTDAMVNWTWSPRWDPETMASEDARLDLGLW